MRATTPRVVVIAGPTAGGKSGLALALAEKFAGTIINADSQQCYADLRVITARPTPDEEARIPHRLFGTLAATDIGSAASWAAAASAEIEAAAAAGRVPIVVGGTGLYLRALTHGLADLPKIPEEERLAARALLKEIGNEAFHSRLLALDPASARLAVGDSQRLARAWEVLQATGTPLSQWQQQTTRPPLAAEIYSVLVLPPKNDLDAAIESRWRTMLAAGAVAEVRALLARNVAADAPVMKSIGVPELARHLAGEMSLEKATTSAVVATRRYAKRQGTLCRNQFHAQTTINSTYSESLLPEIIPKITQFLLTGPRGRP